MASYTGGQAGWRSRASFARTAARMQPAGAGAAAMPEFAMPSPAPQAYAPAWRMPSPTQIIGKVDWSVAYAAFMLFTFIVIGFKFVSLSLPAIIIAFVALPFDKHKLRMPLPAVAFLVLTVWATVLAPFALFPEVTDAALTDRYKTLAIFLASFCILQTRSRLSLFVVLMFATYIAVPARVASIGYVTGQTHAGRAVAGLAYGNSNDLATFMLMAIGLGGVVTVSTWHRPLLRWVAAGSTLLCIVVVILTQSRAAFIGVALMALVGFIELGRRKPFMLGVALVMTVVGLYFAPEQLWKRLGGLSKVTDTEQIKDMDEEGSAGARYEILQIAINTFKTYPVTGVGLNGFQKMNRQSNMSFSSRKFDAHNTYMKELAETGVPGFILLMTVYLATLFKADAARRKTAGTADGARMVALEIGLIGFMVAAFFGMYAATTGAYLFLSAVWCFGDLAMRERALAPA